MNRPTTLVAAAATALAAACSAPTAKVMPLIGNLGISGDVSAKDQSALVGGASANSSFDELGLGENEAALGGMVRLGFGGAELSLAGVGVEFEGTGTTESEFTLGGNTIAAGVDVESDIDLQMVRGLFTWDLIPLGGVDLGVGFGATLFDIGLDLRELGGANRVQSDELIPIPMIGARAAWTWGPVDLRADVGGIVAAYEDTEATFLDGELSAAVEVFDAGDLVVGYRITSLDAQYDDGDSEIDADFDIEGYYVGLQFGF
jgi:hypothetical protein